VPLSAARSHGPWSGGVAERRTALKGPICAQACAAHIVTTPRRGVIARGTEPRNPVRCATWITRQPRHLAELGVDDVRHVVHQRVVAQRQ
jgi:hypothetical protein